MITFKQLETGLPPDIEVQTDDADGEMADMQEAFGDEEMAFVSTMHLAKCKERNDDGYFVFVILGDEAGELGDYYEPLGEYLEAMNQKMIEALGGDE